DGHERKEPAGQRLGLGTEAGVDSAKPFRRKKHAVAVAAVAELVPTSPPRADASEQRQVADLRVLVPSLRNDALPFFLGDVDLILPAAVAASVAVPVLHDRQMADRHRHELTCAKNDAATSAPFQPRSPFYQAAFF